MRLPKIKDKNGVEALVRLVDGSVASFAIYCHVDQCNTTSLG